MIIGNASRKQFDSDIDETIKEKRSYKANSTWTIFKKGLREPTNITYSSSLRELNLYEKTTRNIFYINSHHRQQDEYILQIQETVIQDQIQP